MILPFSILKRLTFASADDVVVMRSNIAKAVTHFIADHLNGKPGQTTNLTSLEIRRNKPDGPIWINLRRLEQVPYCSQLEPVKPLYRKVLRRSMTPLSPGNRLRKALY